MKREYAIITDKQRELILNLHNNSKLSVRVIAEHTLTSKSTVQRVITMRKEGRM